MSDPLSPLERLRLIKQLNSLMQPDFEALVYAIGAPHHLIPSNVAAQGNRSTALLQWVNSPKGCGMDVFLEILDQVVPGEFKLAPLPKVETAPTIPEDIEKPEPISTPKKADVPQDFREDLGNGVALDMVYIPSGRFWMGSPEDEEGRYEWEGPQHVVKMPSFYMGKYPVTQRQWYAVSLLDHIDIELKPNPSKFKGNNLPLEMVNWHEAIEFCNRLSKQTGREYRLPSEAEWEYVCRAGTTTPYYCGVSISKDQANYDGRYESTTEVGRFPPNTFGLHDMHGNVWEWCLDDWHEIYEGAPTDGSAWLAGGNTKVIRGGSRASDPRNCRSAYRTYNLSGNRFNSIGFRVCCSPPRSLP